MFENWKSIRNLEKEIKDMEILSPLLSSEQKKLMNELKKDEAFKNAWLLSSK